MKKFFCLLTMSIIFTSCAEVKIDNSVFVDPFIGTQGYGHTFPNACYPLGLIQVGPESGYEGWDYCAGYQYNDSLINGFSHTRLNGTGCQDLGDILVLPFTGEVRKVDLKGVKHNEESSPGYYSIVLKNFGVKSEMTASEHVAFHSFTYPKNTNKKVLVDFQAALVRFPSGMVAENIIENDSTIVGHTIRQAWTNREFYYVVRFNQPFISKEELPPLNENSQAPRYVFDFGKDIDNLKIKVSLSTKSIDGAKSNLKRETPFWDFDAVRKQTLNKWNELLNRIEIEGNQSQKELFYTSIYRMYVQPNNLSDSGQSPVYSTLSLWDTYRAAHPLYTIITPEYINDFVNSMLVHYEKNGALPIWALWGNETNCMIGNHAVPVIVDAFLKGFDGFDKEKAYKYIKSSLTKVHQNSEWDIYDKYGYFPFDLVKTESVSKTLEFGYDDYCASLMAKELGYSDDHAFFEKRSKYYKNVFDDESKLMRPKDSNGNWQTPFDKFALSHASTHGGPYTEGNAWQYTWHVQHDIDGLIDLMGGEEAFTEKIDSLFEFEPTRRGLGDGLIHDVTGLIGQYAHGNEPSHHVPYLYSLAGKPWKTQEKVNEIINSKYFNEVDGLSGNDDCGQMSAWYVFSSLGFYPVNPCGGEFVLGAPQIPVAKINLPNGKVFNIKTQNYGGKNIYVKKIIFNGKEYTKRTIEYKDIMDGGELSFIMTDNLIKNEEKYIQ